MITTAVFEDTYPDYSGQIVDIKEIEGQDGEFVSANKILPETLANRLPFESLYKHQADGLFELQNENNICVTTSTASGKTLIYALYMAICIEQNPDATGLFIYPTKALSQDQKSELKSLYESLNDDITVGVYDGDATQEEKREIRNDANVVITNFQGLNYYLPHHKKWERIYQNLALTVIDESHMYRGVQGIHTAYIIRRLRRIADFHNSDPQFVLTSATIGNPKEHTQTLIGDTVSVINTDYSPKNPQDIIFWEPPTYDSGSASSHREATDILAYLSNQQLQTLLFAPSRQITELCLKWIAENKTVQNASKFESYNAGHTKAERQSVESQLKSGQLDGVITTTALEVGIDIGSIDAVIVDTYPGQRTSFYQQIGRAGRSQDQRALAVYVASEESIDQHIIQNPSFLLDDDIEDAVIDITNESIAVKHIQAAANEHSLSEIDTQFFPQHTFQSSIHKLQSENLLDESPLSQTIAYTGTERPESNINLYASSDTTYSVTINTEHKTKSLPSVSIERAYRDFHKDATYYHKGKKYIVTEFNTTDKQIVLKPTTVQYYTQSTRTVDIKNLHSDETIQLNTAVTLHKGTGEIHEHYQEYSKTYPDRGETEYGFSTGMTTPLVLETQLCWFEIEQEFLSNIQTDSLQTQSQSLGTLHALEHALIKMSPTVLMTDSKNIGGLSTLSHHSLSQNTTGIFLYDGVSGGVGFTHKMFENMQKLFSVTQKRLQDCSCQSDDGCISCTMSPMCGDDNEPLDRVRAAELIKNIKR